ncbi:hypothetical protein RJ641_022783 [Dillenia turbinata]|uniref:Uncharacterized protein n=1 Tax=Dillenia turbinata TaxID=194707 RepID=A0AAN8UNF8_9MAGN
MNFDGLRSSSPPTLTHGFTSSDKKALLERYGYDPDEFLSDDSSPEQKRSGRGSWRQVPELSSQDPKPPRTIHKLLQLFLNAPYDQPFQNDCGCCLYIGHPFQQLGRTEIGPRIVQELWVVVLELSEMEKLIERETHIARHWDSDFNYVSKRRVPSGPDPIHNRRARKAREPPGDEAHLEGKRCADFMAKMGHSIHRRLQVFTSPSRCMQKLHLEDEAGVPSFRA